MSPNDEAGAAALVTTGVVFVAPAAISWWAYGLTPPWWFMILNFLLAFWVGGKVGAHIFRERMNAERQK